MVGCLFLASRDPVYIAVFEPICGLRRQQQVIDADPEILLPRAALIIPEAVFVRFLMEYPVGIRPHTGLVRYRMSPGLKELIRFVIIGLAFGLIWAIMQYTNGQIRDIPAMIGPILVFGCAGILMWALRQAVVYFRNR